MAAQGLALSGELVKTIISGPCAENVNKLQVLWVPFAEIFQAQATDHIWQSENSSLTATFINLPFYWPRVWYVDSIKFLRKR